MRVFQSVAFGLNTVLELEDPGCLRLEQVIQLGLRPDVKGSLFLPIRFPRIGGTFGVFGGIETALRMRQVIQHVIQGLACHRGIESFSGDLMSIQIGAGQLSLIVEHLLKMRHSPLLVDRITVKPTANVIEDSTLGHFSQGRERHLKSLRMAEAPVVAKQKVEGDRPGEFGGGAESGKARIVTFQKRLKPLVQYRVGQRITGRFQLESPS